jgi:type II secretory pathway pseudopilin PulG/anti-sigma factor RsiW
MADDADHVREQLDAYLHDLLNPDEAQQVSRHCATCPDCGTALAEAWRQLETLQSVPSVEASEALVRRTDRQFEGGVRARVRPLRSVRAAAAAALAAARRRLETVWPRPAIDVWEDLKEQTRRQSEGRVRRWVRRVCTVRVALATPLVLVALTGLWHWQILAMTIPPRYFVGIVGQTQFLAGAVGSVRVVVTEGADGSPLGWVPVEITLSSKQPERSVTLAQFQTDIHGTGSPRFRLPDWADGDCELSVVARPRSTRAEVRSAVRLTRHRQVLVSTDRPVYRPGQTLLFRGLALRQSDERPAGGEKAVFTVSDPKGNKILHEEKTTSRFGIASAELPLAEEVTEGTYRVECRVGDRTGSTSVEVKNYALPKFKVTATPDRAYYKSGDTIRLEVHADYFFGKPVAGAAVTAEVRTSNDPAKVVQQLNSHTDPSGVARLEIPAPNTKTTPQTRTDSGNGGPAEALVDVRVTDSAGQQQQTTVSRPVTDQALRIEVIPEGDGLVPWVANTIYLLTLYPDGRPAPTELEVSGFPDKLRTDDFGVATLKLTPPRDGAVPLKVRARDADGRSAEREVNLYFNAEGRQYLFRTDKAVYDAGETMHVTVLGQGGFVYFDLLKDGRTLWTDSVGVTGGRGECSVDLPGDLSGAVELSAYCWHAYHGTQYLSRVLYVRKPRRLDVHAEAERKEYRPGQLARVSLQLRDPAGKPAPGALSLAAVDEAVFSVAGKASERESLLSPREEAVLRPVRSLYGWSPDVSAAGPAEARVRLEQALFARTTGGAAHGGNVDFRGQLLPFMEDDARAFDVLKRPDWEQLPGANVISPEVMDMLRAESLSPGGSSTLLRTGSYDEQSQQALTTRDARLQIVHCLWTVYALVVGIALGIAGIAGIVLLIFLNKEPAGNGITLAELVCIIAIIGVLIGLLLPQTQAVREASARTQASNNLRQIQLAVESYRLTNGKLPGEAEGISGQNPRVRQWFPETLLWRPEVITDDEGRAEVEVPLADSITDWRLTASAVTADGRLGSTQTNIRAFQPFFVDVNPPAALTRGDEVAFPVVVYNYLQKPQTVTVTLQDADWFQRQDEGTKTLELAAGEVRSTSFRLRALRVGHQEIQVTARSEAVGDALRRTVDVVPDGSRTETVANGNLRQLAEVDLSVPDVVVDGSVKAVLRVYPSGFSQLVEGLDAIFRLPYGCFEQTTSVTYPNVLALDYLQRNGLSSPEVEAKARKYIQLGYQRLLTFEVPGGFDWFGCPPANRTLTACGLMEFEDIARVYDVDPAIAARTRKWLLDQRQSDGSWQPERRELAGGPARGNVDAAARLATTAYIAAAVYNGSPQTNDSRDTRDFLLRHDPASVRDPYALALVCNALLAIEPDGASARPYLNALQALKQSGGAEGLVWWQQPPGGRTMFYGAGRCGDVEATALASLVLKKTGQAASDVNGALAWLTRQRDGQGSWYSTQATVLALKALLAGTENSPGKDPERRIEIALDGKAVQELVIPADQSDVMKQVNLAPLVSKGKHRLRLTNRGNTGVEYQVAFSYHTPSRSEKQPDSLAFEVTYDRRELKAGESVTARASVSNRRAESVPMVMAELAIPPGFTLEDGDLAKLVEDEKAAKFQQTGRSALLYLRSLKPGQTLRFNYRLRATMPGTVTAAPGVAYEYYDPDRVARTDAVRFNISAGKAPAEPHP